ncbi:MAG: (d)CMP kinase [Pseudomonadota bacterium]
MVFAVAIDGPAAAGKGTLARAVAAHFGFHHLDTGLLYRAVGRKVLLGGTPRAAAQTLSQADLERSDLRTPEVAQAASHVAVLPEVRDALVVFQRDFARQNPGAVLDGRDIGTVICPDAAVKLFVTASDAVRAARRFAELTAQGVDTSLDQVMHDQRIRDSRDRDRSSAPMRPADDAVTFDTSTLTIEEAVAQAITLIDARYKETLRCNSDN